MQIIINIPDRIHYGIQKGITVNGSEASQILIDAVKNGIPLPKGHWRIADMDEAIKCLEEVEGEDAIWAIALIEWACGKRTIIEADTESEV